MFPKITLEEHARKRKENRMTGIAREKWMRKTFPFFYRGFSKSMLFISDNQIELARLPKAFDGYKIVHLSDLHYGTWMTAERLEGIVKSSNEAQPDLVVITGDFVSYNSSESRLPLTRILSKIQSLDGVMAIYGNHDHWAGTEPLEEMMKDSNIINLNNKIHTIKKRDSFLTIAGVDDLWEGLSDFESIQSKLDIENCNILLSHEPDYCETHGISDLFDLQLSGHSHGGQMRLPLIGPVLRIPGAFKYPEGLQRYKSMYVYTSRGLGTSTVPVRINCKPEVAIHTLRSIRLNCPDKPPHDDIIAEN